MQGALCLAYMPQIMCYQYIFKVLSAILSSKNLLRLRSSNAYLILITSLVAADGAASALLGVIIILLLIILILILIIITIVQRLPDPHHLSSRS